MVALQQAWLVSWLTKAGPSIDFQLITDTTHTDIVALLIADTQMLTLEKSTVCKEKKNIMWYVLICMYHYNETDMSSFG